MNKLKIKHVVMAIGFVTLVAFSAVMLYRQSTHKENKTQTKTSQIDVPIVKIPKNKKCTILKNNKNIKQEISKIKEELKVYNFEHIINIRKRENVNSNKIKPFTKEAVKQIEREIVSDNDASGKIGNTLIIVYNVNSKYIKEIQETALTTDNRLSFIFIED